MDTGMIMQQVEGWISQQFAGKQTMSKDEIQTKAQGSDLPQEAKDGIQQLPQGDYTQDSLKSKLRDTMMSKVGGGMMGGQGGGGMGGMMGGQGQGGRGGGYTGGLGG